ncbi:MAG: hypothetical protein JWM09_984 [Francisellaceae bacterium]|nr:hypothetical protein [Francisellaceae bacterium]
MKVKTLNFIKTNSFQGASWKILSCIIYALIAVLVRFLSTDHFKINTTALPINTILFFQSLFGFIFLIPWIINQGLSKLHTRFFLLHFLRIIFAILGLSLYYLSLKYFPLAQSVALNFIGPIFTLLAAQFFLNEKINYSNFLAISLSFLGVGFILYPEFIRLSKLSLHTIILIPIFAACFLALSKIYTRRLGKLGESSTKLASFLLLFTIPIAFIPAIFDWVTPSFEQFFWLLLMGLLSALAHLSFAKAYTLAEVTYLLPFSFIKFFLSALFGWLFFQEFPKSWHNWLGFSCIFISLVFLNKNNLIQLKKNWRNKL